MQQLTLVPPIIPCEYMIYRSDGYHQCAVLQGALCLWFYDILGFSYQIEVSVNPETGEKSIISETNLPEVWEEKLSKCPRESDVPKRCPKGYTYDEIDRKIQPLMKKWRGESRPVTLLPKPIQDQLDSVLDYLIFHSIDSTIEELVKDLKLNMAKTQEIFAILERDGLIYPTPEGYKVVS